MDLILYLFVYAFLGWLVEVSYYFYKKKRFVNRGFYHGPIVPIYGVSVTALHIMMFGWFEAFTDFNIINLFFVFGLITIIATFLELIGGSILFNLFETRWWDYSNEQYNYKGYVSLKFSIIWGLAGTFAFYIIHLQGIKPVVDSFSANTLYSINAILISLFIIDAIYTVKSLVEFKKLVKEANQRLESFEVQTDSILTTLSDKTPKSLKSLLNQVTHTIKSNERLSKIKDALVALKSNIKLKEAPDEQEYTRLEKIMNKITNTRLYKAFPELRLKIRRKRDGSDE